MTNKLIVLSMASLLSFSLYAEEAKTHPCKTIKTACESAGYTKGSHKTTGKGLHVDCMKALIEGKQVEGATVSAEEISSCKTKMQEHQAKKAAKKS